MDTFFDLCDFLVRAFLTLSAILFIITFSLLTEPIMWLAIAVFYLATKV